MSAELTLQRDHLRQHRRMLIGRSLAAALASAVPVPVLDDKLCFAVQRGTLRRLARDYQVDLDDAAIEAIIHGKVEEPSLAQIVGSNLGYTILAQTRRRLLLAYITARRAHMAGYYFIRATLFDHYCAKLHVGLGLDAASALALREAMDEALAETPGILGWRMFRRGAVAAARATLRAPVELFHIISGGVVRKLLTRGNTDHVEAVEELDLSLEHQLEAQTSFLSRATTAIELQLSVEANPYLERLVGNFERIWRQRQAAR